MKIRILSLFVALVAAGAASQIARSAASKKPTKAATKAAPKTVAKPAVATPISIMPIYNFKLKNLEGKDVDLSKYQGKMLLIVNTASKCGYTKQYAGLQALHDKYAKTGLAILGFPANNFGAQEPGSDSEIGEFCKKNYGVGFDMFSKLSVKGDDKAPFFKFLTDEANPDLKGEIGWNFEKFLVDRNGKLIARFKSNVAPDAAELVSAIESELARK